MSEDIMDFIWGRRQSRSPAKRAPSLDPSAEMQRTVAGGVNAMVGVTVGTTLLKAIRG